MPLNKETKLNQIYLRLSNINLILFGVSPTTRYLDKNRIDCF